MKFEVVFGVNPGFNHDNEVTDPVAVMTMVWLEQMDLVRQNSGLYISALILPGRVSYPKEFGAPDGGEEVVEVSGYYNAQYHRYTELWQAAVRSTVSKCKDVLEQDTVALLFFPCQVEYMTRS
jgi:hypothetical protein